MLPRGNEYCTNPLAVVSGDVLSRSPFANNNCPPEMTSASEVRSFQLTLPPISSPLIGRKATVVSTPTPLAPEPFTSPSTRLGGGERLRKTLMSFQSI